MRERLSHLFSPLHCAAYLTWAAVLMSLLLGSTDMRDSRHAIAHGSTLLLMTLFLAAFLFDAWKPANAQNLPRTLVAISVEVTCSLLLIALTRDGIAPVLLVIVVAHTVNLPPRWRAAVMCVINLGFLAVLFSIWSARSALTIFSMYFGFQMFAATTGHYAKQATRARDEVVKVNAHLLATHSLLEESARDGERLRLARELHDVAGHKLTALKLQLALLARDPAGVSPAITTAAALANELLGDIRGVVSQMRKNDGLDLRRAIEQLAAPIPHPKVHLDLADNARVDDLAQARALLRVAQEGLTNAARHSGAQNVWLRLARVADRLILEIRDDGRGARNVPLGNGISGMCERLNEVGGGIDFATTKGFRLEAWVPLT